MKEERDVLIGPLTTLGVGGPARRLLTCETAEELLAAAERPDPLLLLAGGSNLVVADSGFDGTVVRVATRGVDVEGADVRAAAGEPWDALMRRCVGLGLAGAECLAGIPGTVGATPIQNVGAYGQEISTVLTAVEVYDRVDRVHRSLRPEECGFGYRTSRFKAEPGRWVVLSVSLRLRPGEDSEPVRYAELAAALGVEPGARAGLRAVHDTVLALRAHKGMLLDPADPDSRSAGSFFTNPVLEPGDFPPGAPAWPQADGRVKTSAAWLIERAGFHRGFGEGPVRVSSKHTLALVTRPGARTSDLLELARTLRSAVAERFGIVLEPEPTLVGCSL